MRYYPRFLKKNLAHQYLRLLAPDAQLFEDFRAALKESGDHNLAFDKVNYEKRFTLSSEALNELKILSELAKKQDVFLVCQCEKKEKCHRHLLLLTAEKLFNAPTDRLRIEYPVFSKRLLDPQFNS